MAERVELQALMEPIGPKVRIEVLGKPEEVDQRAASYVALTVQQGNDEDRQTVLILPTGNTPRGMYHALENLHNNPEVNLDFSRVIVFNLDEYCSDSNRVIGRGHEGSFTQYMEDNFYSGVNIPRGQRWIPNSQAIYPIQAAKEADWYNRKIMAAGKIDLAVLGIGENGHIGFNEPDPTLTVNTETRVVKLAESTRKANAGPFGGIANTPEYAITLGIANILSAERILLLAKGEKKAAVLKQALRGPVTSEVPASFLQLHPSVDVLVDQEAGAELLVA